MTSEFWILNTSILLITVFILLYKYSTRNNNYWKKRAVFYYKPVPFLGNLLDLVTFRTSLGQWLHVLYKGAENEPYFGIFIFDKPFLVLRSPEIIKLILQRDFNFFADRTMHNPAHDKLSSSLLFLNKNPEWRLQRTKMTTVFTIGKLKQMFTLISNVGKELETYLKMNLNSTELEVKEICSKYSTDVIAKCAFAINANCFKYEDAEFRKAGRDIFAFRLKIVISQLSYFFSPLFVDLFRLSFIDKSAAAFLRTVLWSTIKERENSQHKGNDIIDRLVELKKQQLPEFEGDKLIAQAIQFFAAGFETTSSTMAFTLYELCIHPQIQKNLRNEILATIKQYEGITYEALQDMKYLDMCVCETLRKYPVLPFLDRTCTADYKMPGTDLVIEKGTGVYIPMFGLHYDEKYFPDPQKFDPARFADKTKINQDGFYYIPFGEGPRVCIGERFGLLGTKVGLVHILSKFEVERSNSTPVPIVWEAKSFILQSKVGLPMKVKFYNPE